VATNPRPFVFVLMPFSADFDDTYQLAIKLACEKAGAYAERVDEQIFQGSILDRIYNQIAKADLVVADLTGRNPNVFYETGYAHALGKPTILLTRDAEDIPFDFKHYPHIVYQGKLSALLTEVEKHVRWHLENPQQKIEPDAVLVVSVNHCPLGDCPTIAVPIRPRQIGFALHLDFNNSPQRILRSIQYAVGLLTPKSFVKSTVSRNHRCNVVSYSEHQNLHLPGRLVSLLPGEWETITLQLVTENIEVTPGELMSCAVRIFFESGPKDFPFTVQPVLAEDGKG
jgi:hypothetical protein